MATTNSTNQDTGTGDGDLTDLICIKVLTKNGAVLKCPTLKTEDSVSILRQVFEIELSNVFGIATIQSPDRGIGFNYKLKTAQKIDLARFLSFTFEIGQDLYEGKILLSVGPPPKLGEPVIVTIKRTGFHLTIDQITKWLELFGTIEGELKYLERKDIPGALEDTLEVLMRLRQHIPSVLPAFSKKLGVRYRGQPLQCSKCKELGHVRKVCTSDNNNWMAYVKNLVDKKLIPLDYFGSWYEYLQAREQILNEN